jgi:hypothetical protein
MDVCHKRERIFRVRPSPPCSGTLATLWVGPQPSGKKRKPRALWRLWLPYCLTLTLPAKTPVPCRNGLLPSILSIVLIFGVLSRVSSKL